MAVAARVLGGVMVLGSVLEVLPRVEQVEQEISDAFCRGDGNITSKKVARLASVMLECVAGIAFGMARMTTGAEIVAIGSQVGFFASVLSGVKLSVPYITVCLNAMALSVLSSFHGWPVDCPSDSKPIV